MPYYTSIPRDFLCDALEERGFTRSADPHGEELVYERRHHIDPTMYIKVFTSISLDGIETRRRGSDAIRIAVIFKNPRTGVVGGLYKTRRVNRVGFADQIVERTLQRAREAYAFANQRAKAWKQK